MTFRRWFYRYVYMHSLGWRITRWLRKRKYCAKCGSRKRLHLHHLNYHGYHWYSVIVPDVVSKMQTLCSRHHAEAHRKGKK